MFFRIYSGQVYPIVYLFVHNSFRAISYVSLPFPFPIPHAPDRGESVDIAFVGAFVNTLDLADSALATEILCLGTTAPVHVLYSPLFIYHWPNKNKQPYKGETKQNSWQRLAIQ